jgi:glutamate-1-semialdehyde 2,1-aminomutase
MKCTDQQVYGKLMSELSAEYAQHAPRSAALQQSAVRWLVDGGSHSLRLLQPFPPRIVSARGAWVTDEDGNRILDFWQGHFGNILGHNPGIVTDVLARAFDQGFGLQTGFTDRVEVEAARIICERTGSEQVRFTTSGSLATMYALMLARAFTGRELVLKVRGGWHGAQPWGLKGVSYQDGFDHVDSDGVPAAVSEQTILTGFNNTALLHETFRSYGGKLACFILEPVIGAGGMMPATLEYMRAARELTREYGVALVLDEVVSGFRYRAGDVGALYQVQPDLVTLGKAIGGGMPVAAVAGRAGILDLVGRARGHAVKYSGGTYSAHPASMLAARTFMSYLVENEERVYATLAALARETRRAVTEAFAEEGMHVRFAGDGNDALPDNSLHMLRVPRRQGYRLDTPEEVYDPAICDVVLSDQVLQLALLLENVYTVHGLGSTTAAHNREDIAFLAAACRRAARRIKPHMPDGPATDWPPT